MLEWGLVNVKREPWGPFRHGWSNEKLYLHATAPQRYPIIGFPKAWTPGTRGLVQRRSGCRRNRIGRRHRRFSSREAAGNNCDDRPADGGHSRPPRLFQPVQTDRGLEQLSREPAPSPAARGAGAPPPAEQHTTGNESTARRVLRKGRRSRDARPGRGVNGSTNVVTGPPGVGQAGRQIPWAPAIQRPAQRVFQLVIAAEHYNRLFRTSERKIPVSLEMDVDNRFYDDDLDSFNIVGEIRGTDLAHEVVMMSTHSDSWHSATGATDNAAGSAVMLEAMRILKASEVKMRRTVRIALWTGEEQGLLGSRAYVRDHFADRQTLTLKPEHAQLAAYFNVDNGTGAIRGVYLQRNEAVAPVFGVDGAFRNIGMTTLSIRNTLSTDHVALERWGCPHFSLFRTPWSPTHGRITLTWTCTDRIRLHT